MRRDEPRGGGFANATNPGEHIALRDAAGGERIGERCHHGALADQIIEILWPVFARKYAVAGMAASRGEQGWF